MQEEDAPPTHYSFISTSPSHLPYPTMIKDEQQTYSVAIPVTTIAETISSSSNQATMSDEEKMINIRMRKGKWTEEEETYTMKLIEAFIAGVLLLPQGTTLRSFLSEKLCCDPMRITKKFAGSNGIGKQIFSPSLETEKTVEVRRLLDKEIEELERRFFQRIDYTYSSSSSSSSSPRSIAPVEVSHSNGYSVAYPSGGEKINPLSYAELISLISIRKAASSVVDPEAGLAFPPRATIQKTVSPPSFGAKVVTTAKLQEEKVYYNASYRVHGFTHAEEKQELAIVPETKVIEAAVPKSKSSLAKKFPLKDPSIQLLPRAPTLPKMKTAISVDSSIDLQASNLLLDFFRSARDKETCSFEAEDSEESGEATTFTLASELNVKRDINSAREDSSSVDSDPLDSKKMRLTV